VDDHAALLVRSKRRRAGSVEGILASFASISFHTGIGYTRTYCPSASSVVT
jgi:hypothetical protein